MPSRRIQLECLITVAEEGQVTSAARRLDLAQPTLSYAIAQLESELGIQLLERRPRGVKLTHAGEAFLAKARLALAAETDAVNSGQSLARSATGAIAVGFVGPPPVSNAPDLFGAFAAAHPDAVVSFRDLPFPRGTSADWLAGVDVALSVAPAPEASTDSIPVCVEPRTVVARADHPLAGRGSVSAADLAGEAFIGYHPAVQDEWARFHGLDDHRGGPPEFTTEDNVLTALQMLGIMATSRAITTVPRTAATIAAQVLPGVIALPVEDVEPAVVSLVWRKDSVNPLTAALVEIARGQNGSVDGV